MAEVRLEVDLPYPRELVWRALTDGQLLSEWFMPTDLAAREGARFTLEPGTLPGFLGPVAGEVTELASPDRIVMRWQGEKLHTLVVWELVGDGGGCTLRVVQTGFIGAPAALRRRALRDTYGRLLAERLPVVLDRLAGTPAYEAAVDVAAVDVAAVNAAAADGAARLPAPAATVPRQRRAPVNMPVGALATGRPLGGSAAPPPPAAARRSSADPGTTISEPATSSLGRRAPGAVLASLRRLGSAPAWARAVVIGAVTAAVAVLVLAAVVYPPGSPLDESGGNPPTGPEAERGAPGVAVQPGDVTSHTPPAESTGPEGAERASDAPGSAEAGATGGAGVDEGTAPGGGEPEATGSPDPTASAAPVLTAQLTTSDRLLLGLGGVAVTVTVANPGPGSAASWEIAVDVGDQDVTNVLGADYARQGSQAIFTPVDAELAAAASIQFSFDLPGVLASDPSACTIDGNPCG